ncbi:VacJ family lipoprotein [Phragmitibacter flavus]|uniref:VacJ family lipoprotein n=1 Tax=Phragmitibacter flavus TaxID=2576071 RepID=A0A5R8KAR6_9BACT|nr:VacJ family lipoprotein [Phragmitibacter flavus]TLD69402.1 VacJ family lipoprotein [Phragmitibacter flavus]
MKTLTQSFTGLVFAAGLLATTSCATKQNVSSTGQGDETSPLPSTVAGADSATASSMGDGGIVDDGDDYAMAEVSDPWEGFNRGVFRFNDGVYTVLFRPVSKGYQVVFPQPVRKGISNAFDNVRFPIRFVNSTLQGKFKRAGQETGMFAVNTVAGLGGLFKVSRQIPALSDVPPEDTGQTFGTWGMGHGPYFVMPVLGPSSVRDGFGLAFDYALNPVNWGVFWSSGGDWKQIPPYANTIQMMPAQLDLYDVAVENSVDPYISARSVYIQNRKHAVEK